MSKVVVIVANVSENEKIFCERVLSVVTSEKVDIVDVACFPVDPKNDLYYVIFGEKARKLCSDILGKVSYIVIPEPNKLEKKEGNEETRAAAWKELSKLKTSLEQDIPLGDGDFSFSLNDLQPWLTSQVEQFVRNLEIKKIAQWKGKLRDGRDIIFSKEPTLSGELNITYSELIMLKILNDTLGIQEIMIDNKKGNS